MVIKVKQEYLAAGIREQIQALEWAIQDLESDSVGPSDLAWRLRAVELQLRNLREAA